MQKSGNLVATGEIGCGYGSGRYALGAEGRIGLPGPAGSGTLTGMGLAQPVKRYTPQEYYALELEAEYKSEYYQGEIFAMAGGTFEHSLIASNLGGELRQRLKGHICAAFQSDARVAVKVTGLRCYPDVSIYCGPIEFDPEDKSGTTGINPTVLFEVLSKSTEAHDRGFKTLNYRRIPSLRAYVLVSQDTPHIEVYERNADGSWLLREASGLEASVVIPGIDVTLPLAEVYDRVTFPPPVPIEQLSDPVRHR